MLFFSRFYNNLECQIRLLNLTYVFDNGWFSPTGSEALKAISEVVKD